MKRMVLCLIAASCVYAFDAPGARAQGTNPNARPAPKKVKVLLPDLVVEKVSLGQGGANLIKSVRVTVRNTCGAPAPASYVLITFMDKMGAGGKVLYYRGHEVRALKGGEAETQIIEVGNKEVPADSHVAVEVDPYKKLKEDSEDNNFRKLNPNVAPFPDNGATHCKPKD